MYLLLVNLAPLIMFIARRSVAILYIRGLSAAYSTYYHHHSAHLPNARVHLFLHPLNW